MCGLIVKRRHKKGYKSLAAVLSLPMRNKIGGNHEPEAQERPTKKDSNVAFVKKEKVVGTHKT